MPIEKPEQILWLEKHIGVPLHPLRQGNVIDFINRTCYELDDDGQIIGLNLAECNITDGSFLKEIYHITSLNLSKTSIRDWKFLKELNRVESLVVRSNNINDASFLLDMCKLRTLDLINNNICDTTFLKEMQHLSELFIGQVETTDWSFLKYLKHLRSLCVIYGLFDDTSCFVATNQLKELHLRGCFISDWSFLRMTPDLDSLTITSSELKDASYITGINRLTSLNLANNSITDISFLVQLKQLTTLGMSDNDVSDISLLRSMSQIRHLNLSSNYKADLSLLSGMDNLLSLNISHNRMSDVSFLRGMKNLDFLDLSDNPKVDFNILKELNKLKELWLSFNAVTNGSFLEGMSDLESLYLRSNRITDWSFLRKMKQLKVLDISYNGIRDASFLNQIDTPTTLDISGNRIERLPTKFYDLGLEIRSDPHITYSYSIRICNNPLQEPPLEIANQGHAAIMNWYRASQAGEIDINEIKIILVGAGGAGKTTVRKRLMSLVVNRNESITHGIDINDYKITCQDREIVAHFWDFGGQEIMHATHQFFLSRRSLYILVLDGRKEEDADYWLKHIVSFGGDSPVLVCLNKIDQHPGFELDRKNLKEKYPGIRDFYRLKCLDDNDVEVQRLINELPQHIDHVEMSRSKWPRTWANVKDRLLEDDNPFIDQTEFVNICYQERIRDERHQQTLIRYLNDLGVALHFDDRRLKLLQILNPRWATQAVYRIINDPGVAENHGVLPLNRLCDILKKNKPDDFDYPEDKHNYIVELMKKFELCHELPGDSVLLPDLLDIQEPEFVFSKSDILRFRYQYEYLPASIMPRMIVQMHADIDGKLRWRTGVVLKWKDNRTRAVIRSDRHNKRITIEVEGSARRDYFAVIRHRFDNIHSAFQKFTVKEQVPLPDHPEVVVQYSDLLFYEEKKRKIIPVGEVETEYDVLKLLNGIEPKTKREARKRINKDEIPVVINNYQDCHMGDINNVNIPGVNSGPINIGKNISSVIAEKIENSFNKARDAADRSDEIRELLQSLAQEMVKVVEKLPPEKVDEAVSDLEAFTDESIKDKPTRKYWELSKQGIIDAAQAVGAVGETAINLVTKLSDLLSMGKPV